MIGDLDRQASGGPADGGRRTVTAICEATLRHIAMATEVGFPPLFRSSNRFLRFPSDLQNLDMEIVSDTLYLLMLMRVWDFKMVHGCACNVRGISKRRPIF